MIAQLGRYRTTPFRVCIKIASRGRSSFPHFPPYTHIPNPYTYPYPNMLSQICSAYCLTPTHEPGRACICMVCYPKSLDTLPRDVVEALHADVDLPFAERELMLRGILKVSETWAAELVADLMYTSAAKAAKNATAALKGVPVDKENAPSSKRGSKNFGHRCVTLLWSSHF